MNWKAERRLIIGTELKVICLSQQVVTQVVERVVPRVATHVVTSCGYLWMFSPVLHQVLKVQRTRMMTALVVHHRHAQHQEIPRSVQTFCFFSRSCMAKICFRLRKWANLVWPGRTYAKYGVNAAGGMGIVLWRSRGLLERRIQIFAVIQWDTLRLWEHFLRCPSPCIERLTSGWATLLIMEGMLTGCSLWVIRLWLWVICWGWLSTFRNCIPTTCRDPLTNMGFGTWHSAETEWQKPKTTNA